MTVFVDHQLEQGKCRFEQQVSPTFIVCGKLKLESLFGTKRELLEQQAVLRIALTLFFCVDLLTS